MNSFFDNHLESMGIGTLVFLIVFFGIFTLFVCAFAFAIARGVWRWSRNNNSPLVTVPAVVVTRRGHTTSGSDDTTTSTSYFVTFEERGGDRREMHMSGNQYGMLVEGDRGLLTYQGSRYKGFDRTPRDLPY